MAKTWLPPDLDNILPELKVIDNWVLAKAVLRDGKWTKPPYQPSGQPASHSDPATWSSFHDVAQAYQRGGFIGVGFVLDGIPHFGGQYLHGFDWDNCFKNGKLVPGLATELRKLGIGRIEKSISGTGIRGFFLHTKPLPSRRTIIHGRSVEIYSSRRYMTTTGIGAGVLR